MINEPTMLRRAFLAVITASTLLSGCGGGGGTPAAATPRTLSLNLSSVKALKGGLHYEGWAVFANGPATTGKFNVMDDTKTPVLLSTHPGGASIPNGDFTTNLDLSSATTIVITIEPNGDTDTLPATTKIFGGNVSGGSATLKVGHSAALGSDFATATGKFILATPTDGTGTAQNERSGIWFVDLPGPTKGLTLPTLAAGWKYEGWAVINGVPVTTGTFTKLDSADEAKPFSGATPGPEFPGEDFLQNAPAGSGLTFPTDSDLRGQTAVITIEPSPDDSSGPFFLKPLVGLISTDAVDHTVFLMTNKAGEFPTGTATIK